MPEITQADRDAARALQSDNINRLALRSVPEESLMDMLARHLAAHREAERERIVEHLKALVDKTEEAYGVVARSGYELAISDIGSNTTTTPEPRELTAEIVKEMLPVRDGAYRTNTATYLGKFGSIEWIDLHSGFLLYVSGRLTQLSELTAAKFAALVAAFGIDAGVEHG